MRPTVVIFSDANFLAVNLVEKLLSKISRVVVFSKDTNTWRKRTSHITNRTNFEIADEKDIKSLDGVNYVIFLNGFTKKENGYKDFKEVYVQEYFRNIKTIAIFPFEIFDPKEDFISLLASNLAIVYVGDLMGSRIDLESDLFVANVINEAVNKREIQFGVGEVFYPIAVTEVAKKIVSWVFSFGPYGKETFLLGDSVSGSLFWKDLKKIIPDLIISYDSKLPIRKIPRGYEITTIPTNLVKILRETFVYITKNNIFRKTPKKEKKEEKVRKTRFRIKAPNPLLLIVLFILILPYFCLLVTVSLFYFSYKTYLLGNGKLASDMLLLSKTTSAVGKRESYVFKHIPLLSYVYKESYYGLNVSERISDVGINAIHLIDNARYVFESSLSDSLYDPGGPSTDMKIYLDKIYSQVSLIQLETNDALKERSVLARKVASEIDFDKLKQLVSEGGNISSNLPDILGKNGKKTYLVIFQNNMELRPTGGFIGSFGLMSFEGGRMTDFTLSDVYSADGQLKGHVEPPAPIREYLGEANWFLRDSNWDPDFPTSARRIEWFLDKEIDKQVDGVVSLDLDSVKKMLELTGPIYLTDYNLNISSDNLYEETQSEVEGDFFAGTHKKASFLTALSRNLVTEVSSLDSGKKVGVLKAFYKSLEQKHMQVFLHEEGVQSSFSNLGWSGEVLSPDCGETCYADLIGVVEANVGVNKANLFIKRDQKLKVEITDKEIKRELVLNLENSANPDLGPNGKYKAYIRILVPSDAKVVGNYEVTDSKGRKEIGFLEELLAGQKDSITINWSTPKGDMDSYGIYFRKQSGTDAGPLSVLILADGKEYSYNTTLYKDFLNKITW